MELADRFSKMISFCDQIPLAQFERDRIKVQLEYFLKQSLCDLDRRDAPQVIHQNFKVMLQGKKILNVLSKFRGQPQFWSDIAIFVGDVSYQRSLSDLKLSIESEQEFFRHLAVLVRRMPESQRVIKLLVRFGVQILILESERPLALRHPEDIEYVWRTIWPLLDRAGLLREFQSDERLKEKVRAFINCEAAVRRERLAQSLEGCDASPRKSKTPRI